MTPGVSTGKEAERALDATPVDSRDLTVLRALAVHLAAEAEVVPRAGFILPQTIHTKSSPTDLVTEVDREGEHLIVSALETTRPHVAILGEEGTSRACTSGVRWIIEPVDGTTSSLYGYPACVVSIGVEIDGQRGVGV